MAFSEKQKQQLLASPRGMVRTLRVDGREVEYIPARDVIRELNAIFGEDGWSSEIVALVRECDPMRIKKSASGGKTYENWYVAYRARVRITTIAGGEREDPAVGDAYSNADRNPPNYDMAAKAAVSGALKRAARTFGPRLGMLLGDEADPYGEQYADFVARQATNDAVDVGEPAPPEPERTPDPAPTPPPASTPFPEGMTREEAERHVEDLIRGIIHRTGVHPAPKFGKPSDFAALSDDDLAALAAAMETKDIETKESK